MSSPIEILHMKVRSAGLKFKIATNFIWRVGRGVHHRHSTPPPYGWSSHEVNSERLFFSAIRRVEQRGVKRGDKVQVLFPETNMATWNKRQPICALPALSKSATSSKRNPICAQLTLSRLATSNNLDPPAFCLLSQSGHRVIV